MTDSSQDTTSKQSGAGWKQGLGWGLIVLGGVWLLLWAGVPLSAPDAPPRCQPVKGMVRGVTHVHTVGHDYQDRSEEALAVAVDHCFDFMVSTEHDAIDTGVFALDSPVMVLDGAEWDEKGHHHSQIVGAVQERGDVDEAGKGFRILNHPHSSGARSWEALRPDEQRKLASGELGVELLNSPRLVRYPRSIMQLVWGALVGPARDDLLLNAVISHTPDLELWLSWQERLERSIPFACGTDAHGELLDYELLYPSAVMYLPAPDGPLTAQWIVDRIRSGEVLCINEYLGSPGLVSFGAEDCELDVKAALPADGEWRVLRGGEIVERGRGNSVLAPGPGLYHLELWRDESFGLLGSHERLWGLGRSHFLDEHCGK